MLTDIKYINQGNKRFIVTTNWNHYQLSISCKFQHLEEPAAQFHTMNMQCF